MFADRLRERRSALGLSQFGVASRVGVTPQTIAAWEHGRTSPTLVQLDRLASALRCRAAWLLDGAGSVEDA